MKTNIFILVTLLVFLSGFMFLNSWLLYIICPDIISVPVLVWSSVLLLSFIDVVVWCAIGNKIGVLSFKEGGEL